MGNLVIVSQSQAGPQDITRNLSLHHCLRRVLELGHRGLGRQASLMWFNILGFWVVGFTSGWALTFKAGLGLSGIWIGILSGVTTTGMPLAYCPLHSCLSAVSNIKHYSSVFFKHGHPTVCLCCSVADKFSDRQDSHHESVL